MALNYGKELKVRCTFRHPILGTKPNDPEIHAHYVASKAPDAKTMAEEVEALGSEAVEEMSKTVFPKLEDGTPFMYAYMVKGFFKEAARAMKKVPGTKTSKATAYIKTIDNFIDVCGPYEDERILPMFMPIDLDLKATDNQRPLRAQTMQGERVALAHSEEAPQGTYIEFTVRMLRESDEALVREWLDYGELKGMGQWRNAGWGKFSWEEVD